MEVEKGNSPALEAERNDGQRLEADKVGTSVLEAEAENTVVLVEDDIKVDEESTPRLVAEEDQSPGLSTEGKNDQRNENEDEETQGLEG